MFPHVALGVQRRVHWMPGWRRRGRCVDFILECAPSYARRQLTHYLDQFIIGQESAKKVLSVGYVGVPIRSRNVLRPYLRVFNHYNRVQANASYREAQEDARREYEESARTIYDHERVSPPVPSSLYPPH